MADQPDNLTLVDLRRLDTKMDRVIDDLQGLKVRVPSLDENQAGLQRRMDRFEMRLQRIERGLDLVETH